MTRHLTPVRAALAAALACSASLAAAQYQATATFTLVSAALPNTAKVECTVTNVSNQSVTMTKLDIAANGAVVPNPYGNTCVGTLAPGDRCTVGTAYYPVGQIAPHCRARFTATSSDAVTGSFRGSSVAQSYGIFQSVLPLQPLVGLTLQGLVAMP